MKIFQLLRKVFIRELRLVSRDINILAIAILAPLFYSFFYGAMYIQKVESNVEITIINHDKSETANKLIRFFDSNQMLNVNKVSSNIDDIERDIISEEAKAVVYIPRNFEKDLKKGKQSNIKIYLNSTKFLVSNDLNKAINQVIAEVSGGIKVKYFETKGYNFAQSVEIIQPVKVDIRPLFSFTESYGDFLLPAVLILILQQTLIMALAQSFAKEREETTLQSLYNISEKKLSVLINGKSFLYFMLFGAYITFFYLVNFYIYKLQNIGGFFLTLTSTILFLIAVIYFAVFVSTFFKRKIVTVQFITLTTYPIFLLSGYSWPFSSLPNLLKVIAMLFPTTPFYAAFTRISLMGATFNDVIPELFHLLVLIVVYYVVAYWGYLKLIRDKKAGILSIFTNK